MTKSELFDFLQNEMRSSEFYQFYQELPIINYSGISFSWITTEWLLENWSNEQISNFINEYRLKQL